MTEASLKPGWTKVKFGEVVRLCKDRSSDPEADGIERYVGLEHLEPEDLRIRSWGLVAEGTTFTSRFKPGQVLFGKRRAYQRKVAVADFEGVCSGDIYIFESADPKHLLPEILPFICQANRFFDYAVETSMGSLSPRTNWNHLKEFEFTLPPLHEQERILKLLVSVEENLNFQLEAEENAKRLWRSLSFHEFSPDKCLEDNPLKNYYSIVSGQVDPKQEEFARLPLIAPNHIEGETGRLLGIETAAAQSAISGKYLYEAGSVLYSKIRPNLVKATIAPCKGLCSADMYALKPNKTLNKEYLLELVLSDVFTQFAVSNSMRTGMPKLNRAQLEMFNFTVPPIEAQENYLQKTLAVRTAWKEVSARKNKLAIFKKRFLKEVWSEPI
jgi:restriction endonuclease S subunit